MSTALSDVLAERARQDAKWGEQNHDPFTYLTVLAEEFGEFAQAALHTRFGGPAAAGLRTEAVHVAAVALAIVECLDRGSWIWPIVPLPTTDPDLLRDQAPGWLLAQCERVAALGDAEPPPELLTAPIGGAT